MSFKHPVTGAIESVNTPYVLGTYCPVFDWDYPDREAFDLLPKYMQIFIQKAENYSGSQIEALLKGKPSDEGTEDLSKDSYGNVKNERPAEQDLPF